ncbi:MAG: sigma-70 family RNA polymerase sigma factor [Pedosphaera sp.]|nr:sigma-70 family RNA polymerase sigma factor [Pedosphaera sp.]
MASTSSPGMLHLTAVRFSAPIRIMPPPAQRDLPSLSDQELVALAQKGDMALFEELVFRHRDKVYARAYLMMHQEDAALDASQAAWVKGWQRLAQFKGDSSFSTWMTRVVINVCLDDLRKQKRVHLESIEEMDEETGGVERQMPVVIVNPTEGMEQDELRRRIDDALDKLSSAHRTVLVLHEFEGLEYKEISARVGISIGTVMSRLFYARRKMATLLQGLRKERTS